MLNVLSLFSGIGAFEAALDRIGCHYQLTGYCEIDPHASRSYSQIHGVSEDLNLRDVTTLDPALIDLLGGADLITYGFPCQDISVAGKQQGFTDENGNLTRSGLFFEALRIIKALWPKYAIAENVKALTGKKFTAEFETVLTSLDKAGYNNYWSVLNAKDYGIPQNRERVFIVSIRKDVDNGGFKIPEKMPLNIRVKDILDASAAEKYYINTDRARELINKWAEKNKITTVGKDSLLLEPPKILQIGNLIPDAGRKFTNPQTGRVYDPQGLSPTINTAQGGQREVKIIEATPEGYRIRKLTPRECFRLMGFTDAEFDRIKGISNTQLYKQAGNSIVVNVLAGIFNRLLTEEEKA